MSGCWKGNQLGLFYFSARMTSVGDPKRQNSFLWASGNPDSWEAGKLGRAEALYSHDVTPIPVSLQRAGQFETFPISCAGVGGQEVPAKLQYYRIW
jgi:hypothetical protein